MIKESNAAVNSPERASFSFSEERVAKSRLPGVDFSALGFGRVFGDHVFSMRHADGVWGPGSIEPYAPLVLDPAALVLHYGQTVFEGLKVFRGQDGVLRIFRPLENARRLRRSCERLCIPTLPQEEWEALFLAACVRLVELDHAWVPKTRGHSLYLRPLIMGTEATLEVREAREYRCLIMSSPVAGFFSGEKKGISLMVESHYVRAPEKGGLGGSKTAANYASSLYPAALARAQGYDQVLWLDGGSHEAIEEAGAMNIFFQIAGAWHTPELTGSILPGVMRSAVLELARKRGITCHERRVTIAEIVQHFREGKLEGVFVAGTAVQLSPVHRLGFRDEVLDLARGGETPLFAGFRREFEAIQLGEAADSLQWMVEVRPGKTGLCQAAS